MSARPHVDDEFRALIPPLTAEELSGLEADLRRDGCLDAMRVWRDEQGDILLDGHNRLEICARHELAYRVEPVPNIANRDAAMVWIINNQFHRRNLTSYQRAELALKLEPLIAEKAKERQQGAGARGIEGGRGRKKTLPQKSAEGFSSRETRTQVAQAAGVSHDTIHKAKVIKEQASEPVKRDLRQGKTSINKAYQQVRQSSPPAAKKPPTKPRGPIPPALDNAVNPRKKRIVALLPELDRLSEQLSAATSKTFYEAPYTEIQSLAASIRDVVSRLLAARN